MKRKEMQKGERPMKSVITSKYQTTIPKKVREKLKLAVNDALEWKDIKGQIVVYPVQKRFLLRRNSVMVGCGDSRRDIEKAREQIAENYR
jgi:AbrB family looped-hinge helix DNA binding protein